jgi:ketosteroid isomerase-like protein
VLVVGLPAVAGVLGGLRPVTGHDVELIRHAAMLSSHLTRSTAVVVLGYTMHGTVMGTGAPYVKRFISVITIKDRKIVYWRDYLDPLAVLAAFGNTPAPTDLSPLG